MFSFAILLWILLNMQAPTWCYVLLGVASVIKCIDVGINLAKKER